MTGYAGPERRYQLKLSDGRTVRWSGRTGEDAARRYVDAHRDAAVVAFRQDQTPDVHVVHPSQIIG